MGGVFGGWAGGTGSGRLRVVGWIKCGAGLVRLSLAHVGNVPSSWSHFLAEGAVWINAQVVGKYTLSPYNRSWPNFYKYGALGSILDTEFP